MKTVSGNVVSSKPISLAKAAKILSKFVTFENGASHAISAYLQRASTAFDELAQLGKELKTPKSERSSKQPKSEVEGLSRQPNQVIKTNQTQMGESHGELINGFDEGSDSDRKKHKKHKKEEYGDESGSNAGAESEKKKTKKSGNANLVDNLVEPVETNDRNAMTDNEKKKVSESGDVEEEGGLGFLEPCSAKKKNTKRGGITSLSDNVVVGERHSSKETMGNEEEVRQGRKKRRSEEIEGHGDDDSMERRIKKKRKKGAELD